MKSPDRTKNREDLQNLWRIAEFYDKRQSAIRILRRHYRSGQILTTGGKVPLPDFLRSQTAAWATRKQSGLQHSISILEGCLGFNDAKFTPGSRYQIKGVRSQKPNPPVDHLGMANGFERNRIEQSRWLAEVTDRLATCRTFKCREIQYWNHPDLPEHLRVQGYYVCFQVSDHYGFPLYVMISRSNTNEYIELEQIVRELNSSDIVFLSNGFGEYYAHRSRKRGPGKYSTIKFGTRWYMISVCGTLKPYHKLIMEDGPVVKPLDMSFKDWLERSAELRPKDG